MKGRAAWLAACASVVGLIFLCVAWELFLAPVRAGGSWLVLKALPKALEVATDDASRAEGGRILYIEDNLSNLTLVEQMLAEQPHIELVTAMQGSLGLDLARKHLPDLILLDLHLPDLPGHEVLARLRADKLTCEIPVVVISADATTRQIQRLLAAGASNYLTKPLDIGQFFRVIDETMHGAERQLEAAVA